MTVLIPWGTWFVGATFVLRDLVQQKHGRVATYKVIVTALIISALMSISQNTILPITLASAIAYFVSESSDTEVFTRLRATYVGKVFWSGIIGGFFDSSIFVILGLGPWGAGFLRWQAVPAAIIGQWIVKSLLQGAGALIISKTKLNKPSEEQMKERE